MVQRLRIFVSSPGDVTTARLLAREEMMSAVADAYTAVRASPRSRTATLWESLGAKLRR